MKKRNTKMNVVQSAVNRFFGANRVCYATPNTPNHSANFYGDTYICKLTRPEVVGLIEGARDGWDWTDENGNTPVPCEPAAIEAILNDLQLDKPTKEG